MEEEDYPRLRSRLSKFECPAGGGAAKGGNNQFSYDIRLHAFMFVLAASASFGHCDTVSMAVLCADSQAWQAACSQFDNESADGRECDGGSVAGTSGRVVSWDYHCVK